MDMSMPGRVMLIGVVSLLLSCSGKDQQVRVDDVLDQHREETNTDTGVAPELLFPDLRSDIITDIVMEVDSQTAEILDVVFETDSSFELIEDLSSDVCDDADDVYNDHVFNDLLIDHIEADYFDLVDVVDSADFSSPDVTDLVGDMETVDAVAPDLFDAGPDEFFVDAVDLIPDEVEEPPCEVVPIESCSVRFAIEPSFPMVQDYVWLTGSFNGWAESLEDGAVPLMLDDSGAMWWVDWLFPQGEVVQFKYLMGWSDNPEPEWVTHDWDFSSGSPNSWILVECGETGCGPATLLHGPRLQWPGEDGFWILSETDVRVPLEYTATWEGGQVVVTSVPQRPQLFWRGAPAEIPEGYHHRTQIQVPDSVDEVTITITKGPEWTQTVTLPRNLEVLKVGIYGDTRSQSEPHQMVVDAVMAENPDLTLVAGDFVDFGGDWEHWLTWEGIEAEILSSVFWLPVYGNHDWDGGGRTYLEHWFQTGHRYRSGGSYWLDLGLVGLVALDSYDTDFSTPEALAWLDDKLALLQDKEWLLVTFHEPYYNFMGHTPWWIGLEFVDPLLQTYDVDLVISGHDHAYEHFLVDGMHYLVTGGGGAPLSKKSDVPPPELEEFHVFSGAFYHYLILDVSPSELSGKVVMMPDEQIVDEFVLTKQ